MGGIEPGEKQNLIASTLSLRWRSGESFGWITGGLFLTLAARGVVFHVNGLE